jgi:hypothetical protein
MPFSITEHERLADDFCHVIGKCSNDVGALLYIRGAAGQANIR